LRLLAPIAPHISETLWQQCGFGETVIDAPWPQVDPAALTVAELTLVLQINGKTRGKLVVPAESNDEAIRAAALAHEAVAAALGGRSAQRVIIVPGRLVNVVG